LIDKQFPSTHPYINPSIHDPTTFKKEKQHLNP